MLCKSIFAAAALLGLVAAQVHTDCNPMERDCPADPAFGTDHNFNFNVTPSGDLWETTAGTVTYDAQTGAAFTINKQGDSPTIRTKFYFFFGRTEIHLKVAPGRGIVSSMMWLSDDLDEVDWEFLGSNKTFATTNYFGKGRQDFKNGGSHPMTGMQDDYHNYTTVWTKESIEWFIDGNRVRTLNAKDANNTLNYPQTPMRMSVGIWAGGDPSLPEGTRQWAGGDTDYANGPYTMYLKSAQVADYSSGKEYTYGDRSGSWESIKIASGNSTALAALNKQPDKSLGEKWNDLPSGAKAAVYAGGAVVAALAVGTLLWYYIRQRRIGAAEAKAAAQREDEERRENARFLKDGVNPDGFTAHGQEYNASELRAGGVADKNTYHVLESSPFDGPFDEKSRLGSSASNVSSLGGAAGAGVVAAGAMRGQPGRTASPAPSSHRGFDFGVPPSPGHPPRSQSPGMPQSARQHQMRGDSSPDPYSRTGSPGPRQQGYGLQRMQSPGAMGPQRSFTDDQQPGYGYRGPVSPRRKNNGW
ncbi:Concanavalin A-like lectin/glucanase, subgroup [Metarhizium album ARSEF 1941]|uniref:chitinase n=1 Tax=Metarhizium album (strain ARSEF 1941) TaxID=1081103 RepID=A0A0B2X293_METAS|nr:Concanavalin A-like lectin/glucanase, subgroup [Metarhizium album ARSEF 1941]KHN99842.1 Concanavalin A-like lectin/glucanase, subgroup [Metarhizium album ARSEF 1941]